MTKTIYTRPSKSNATAIGERSRARWCRLLRKKLFSLIPPVEYLAAEEGSVNNARNNPFEGRPAWVTARIRIDQMATLELLQARHLAATGKEISRAEVLAALMAAGLETVLNLDEFGGTRPASF